MKGLVPDTLTTSGAYDLLEPATFVTRFGGVDAKDRALSRLHGLLAKPSVKSADAAVELLEDLIGWLFDGGRVPSRAASETEVQARTRVLLTALDEIGVAKERVRRAVRLALDGSGSARLFADVGVSSSHGFVRELSDRLSKRLLPEPPFAGDLSRLVYRLFGRGAAGAWLLGLPAADRDRLLEHLNLEPQRLTRTLEPGAKDAALLLATRSADLALSDELRSAGSDAPLHASPWLELVPTVKRVVAGELRLDDAKSVLTGCRAEVQGLLSNVDERGISIERVFLQERLSELFDRLTWVLHAVAGASEAERDAAWRQLGRALVTGAERDKSIGELWNVSTRRLARRVVERAGHGGEKYMTRTRAEQLGMLRAAAGGGAVTGLLVLLKFVIGWVKLPPFFDALAVGLNYAWGFVAMQIAHFALATKQPSMTAATLAGTIERQHEATTPNFEPLVDEVARASRTQLAALVGNVAMVVPVALVIELGLRSLSGSPVLDEKTAEYVIRVHHPLWSVTVFSAAMTGVWLWASSLIAGATENWFALKELPGAIASHRGLRRWIGAERALKVSRAVTNNIAAFGGNVGFGLLLGFMPLLFNLIGVPLQVRHITFVAGQLTYAAAFLGLDGLTRPDFLWALAAVPLTGFLNFTVSFALAIVVALRARGLGVAAQWDVATHVARRFVTRPAQFFIAPRVSTTGTQPAIRPDAAP